MRDIIQKIVVDKLIDKLNTSKTYRPLVGATVFHNGTFPTGSLSIIAVGLIIIR